MPHSLFLLACFWTFILIAFSIFINNVLTGICVLTALATYLVISLE